MDIGASRLDPILIVDDEPMICNLVAEVVKREGYAPKIYMNPKAALNSTDADFAKLAFIDIRMPEMDGLELSENLKQRNSLLEIVIMTGHGAFENAVQAVKLGAYDYLRKPFKISEISLCLRRFEKREALRKKIREADQRYLQLVQNIPLIIFVLNRDYSLDYINHTVEATLGYKPLEAVNKPGWFLERIHEEDRSGVRSRFEEIFSYGAPSFSKECRFTHRRGNTLHAIVKSLPGAGAATAHNVERVDGIIIDISERVFLEKAVVQKEKLKTLGAISAEVAHEIRNPLMSIGGFARRLQKQHPELPECGIILHETKRLERMLERIRDYLRPAEPVNRDLYVRDVLDDCLALLEPEIEWKGVSCKIDMDEGMAPVYADPGMLKQVFINLIRNAVEDMDRKFDLTMKARESANNVDIIFENFVHRARKFSDPETMFLPFDEGGHTIGLPLCYRLVKNMGGVLAFRREDRKVIFTVSFPKKTADLIKNGPDRGVGGHSAR
jgi:two-component system, NtrC family, sensor histidine kinase HydH